MSNATDKLSDALVEFISAEMESIIDDKVSSAVENALDDLEIETDNVRGLVREIENAVDSVVDDKIHDALNDFNPEVEAHDVVGLDTVIKEEFLPAALDEALPAALVKALDTDEFKAALEVKVREAMANVMRSLLTFPVAQPVNPVS